MPKWERLMFWLAYLRGRVPWDTNVTPPELVNTVEGPDALPPGRALDLGCGTGTNVIYLAKQGWQAVGVDFVGRAIQGAREKAQGADVAAHFYAGDVTRLKAIPGLTGTFDLALDIGCFHSLKPERRKRYASGLVDRLRPGATYLLYAWGPRQGRLQGRGVTPAEVKAIFAPHLQVLRVQQGEERGWPSAWYWLRHSPQK
jgi:SAM-dependent methyltransferase